MLKTFVKQIGGADAVAKTLSELSGQAVTANAVYQWSYLSTIPHRWRPYVARIAEKAGVALPPELEVHATPHLPAPSIVLKSKAPGTKAISARRGDA